jgi:hypothetical protein
MNEIVALHQCSYKYLNSAKKKIGSRLMTSFVNPFPEIGRKSVETAVQATRISMDSAERVINVQLEVRQGRDPAGHPQRRAARKAKTCRS